MSIRDYKITDAQFSEKGVIAAPDTLTGTAAENKGVFDRFAREIIAPQFNAIVDLFADMEESTNNWSAEEAQRVQQENARQTAEQGRARMEGQRETNETARLLTEENRISAENDRVTAETARVNAENKRDSAEKSRVSAENGRVNAESARVTAESQRANAESVRTQNESARVSAETGRADAEADRVSAEDTRIAGETARKTAETNRASAEAVRESGEAARKSAETGRVSAETARAYAESTRQTSETARVSAEKSRAAAETARQSAETARNVWEAYDAAKTYVPGNKVSFNGSSYVCTAATAGHAPTDTAYWLLIAKKGEDGAGAGDMLASVYDPKGKAQDVFAYTDALVRGLAKSVGEYFLPLRGGKMTGPIIAPESGELIKGYGATDTQYAKYFVGDYEQELRAYGVDNDVKYSSFVRLSPANVVLSTSGGNTHCVINMTPDGAFLNRDSDVTSNNELITKKYVDDAVKTAQPVAHLVTLTASGWNSSAKTQTVSCADVVADETAQQILPMPAAASMSAYNDAGILCTGQGAGTLTFTADTVPTTDLQVYVTITPVQFS